jgi:tetratricopeptide (TPR) repeat protein/TolB-like protein
MPIDELRTECLDDDTLASFVSGRLPPDRAARIEEHVAGCSICGQLLAHGLESHAGPVDGTRSSFTQGVDEEVAPLGPGDVIGRYVVLARLGAGAMGFVYAAQDPKLNRRVAVKVLRGRGGAPASHVSSERLLREARAMARLVHPNVVAVHDVGELGDQVFVAMQLVDGGTLRAWLAEAKRPWRDVLAVCASAGRGLAAAHAAGIVHRDFKPDNVLVSRSGEVRVTDFGLARAGSPTDDLSSGAGAAEGEDVARSSARAIATAKGTLLGTPAYMAPEQMRCEPATVRSDVFSFCATVHEALYGVRPFAGTTLAQLRDDASAGRLVPPPVDTQVPPAVRRVLEGGLRPQPEDRHASIDAVLDALDRAAKPLRRRGWMVVAAAALVAAGAIVAVRMVPSTGAAQGRAAQGAARSRPSVAVVGVWAAQPSAEGAWMQPVLVELLANELDAGERLRVIPGDTVARLRRDFQIDGPGALTDAAVVRFARAAGADYVVAGTFTTSGGSIRLDGAMRDGQTGKTTTELASRGDGGSLPALVAPIAERARAATGTGAASSAELSAARSAMPRSDDAMRWYAAGLAALRDGDLRTARAALERSIAIEPSPPRTHGALAQALTRINEPQLAADEARRALGSATGLGRAEQLWLEGLALEAQRRWDEAIDTYKALLRFYPDEIEYGVRLVTAQNEGERFADAYATLDALRQRPAPASDDPRIDWLEARIADAAGDYRRDQQACERAARKAADLGERLVLADARAEDAWASLQLGESARARAADDEAERLYTALGDRSGRSFVLRIRSSLLQSELDYAAALRPAEEALSIVRELGDPRRVQINLMNVAGARGLMGQIAASASGYEEVAAMAKASGMRGNQSSALSNLGLFRAQQGRFAEARAALKEGIAIERDLGTHREHYHYSFQAYLELLAGDLAAARAAAERAGALAHDARNTAVECDAARFLALVDHERRDAEAVRRSLERAQALAPQGSSQIADVDATRATIALDDGHARDAAELALRAEGVYRQGRADDEAAKAAATACRALLATRDLPRAREACGRADARAAATEAIDVAVRVALAHAELAATDGRPADAAAALDDAAARATRAGALGLLREERAAAARIAARRGSSTSSPSPPRARP